MNKLLERIELALGALGAGGPRRLTAFLERPAPDEEASTPAEIVQMIDMLLADDPNSLARLRFSGILRSWDNAKDASWVAGTTRNTPERRKLIHERLQSGAALAKRIDEALPFYPLDEPVIISEKHVDWYDPRLGIRDYYWRTYVRYLRQHRGWDESAILTMDNTTRAIVECLANPESKDAYASRGLVMGYVQSGKTANFMGVAARAADAGYRLIIVLAGTWNILRNQTQRRFDKELLGKELLSNDDTYVQTPPKDWDEFLEHGADPSTLGHYVWQRLTRPDIDFKALKSAIDILEFEKKDKTAPIYDPANLHDMPVKLLVVKKHSGILTSLAKDLGKLRTKLADLPALIIDDESDQAGLNTIDPKRAAATKKKRSSTNKSIVELLKLFPRGQYVGYTATPYANALVDPDDDMDLFPRDFIVSLDRPADYMGVSDFFDPETDYADLDRNDFSLPEIAFIRRVNDPQGSDDADLMTALRSYVLAGGLKLYRHAVAPRRYKAKDIKHHTMLIHTSQSIGEHATLAARLQSLWDQCAFNSPKGMLELEKVWAEDHSQVSAAQGTDLVPPAFRDLIPHLAEAIKRIERGSRVFLVLNSDSPDAPDFAADPVWKIVVGGNKLSRGYTIEGLTVSYYRRVAGTGDTLMQMGRWFGFRPGYKDLVRVFLGVAEGTRGDIDLVSLFKEVCRMEERFREDIKRYVRTPGTRYLTPKEIPPLISVSGNLPPTAKNKMFNAVLKSRNFGGRRTMPLTMPVKSASIKENQEALSTLLSASVKYETTVLAGTKNNGAKVGCSAAILESGTEHVVAFLKAFRWLETDYEYPKRPADMNLQIEFLEKEKHGIRSWLILAPQRKTSYGPPLALKGFGTLSVKERHRVDGRAFQVFGESLHRLFANYFAGLAADTEWLEDVSAETGSLKREHCGVMLLYPVRESPKDSVSIGFELVFPRNDLPFDLNFTVMKKLAKDSIVV